MTSDWLDLDAPPALPGLFLRAAMRHSVRGRQLPTQGLRCRIAVDARHLRRYHQVCDLPEDGYLPPAYPHILAFALQMQLLTRRDFPFPLLGLVHLENRIRVLRPLGAVGAVRISVQLADLQPHDKGAVFSILTHLEDSLGLLWEGDSRILCRKVRLEGPPQARAELPPLPLLPLAQWSVPGDTGRRFARVSGDYNPIHLFALSARLFGFPRAIAHGLWNKARSLAALHAHLPRSGYEVTARFHKPVLLPTQVSLQASAPAPHGQFRLLGAQQQPHMSGSWRLLDED